jgi:hypothetical protein
MLRVIRIVCGVVVVVAGEGGLVGGEITVRVCAIAVIRLFSRRVEVVGGPIRGRRNIRCLMVRRVAGALRVTLD